MIDNILIIEDESHSSVLYELLTGKLDIELL